jgi:ATP-dependent exoDNAse (exonuclease V) beta subunit
LCELPLVHEELLYGGTIDLLANLNPQFTLIDFKSSNHLYAEHRIQVAAYAELLCHVYKEWEVSEHLLAINKI